MSASLGGQDLNISACTGHGVGSEILTVSG